MQTKNSEEIIGRWEAVQTTKGGLGSRLGFNRDGSLNFSFGPLLHGTYKLEGSHLIEKIFQPDGSQTTENRKIEIQGDTLIINDDDTIKGFTMSFVRQTPRDPASAPIVGRWMQKMPTSFYDFKGDGSLVFGGDFLDSQFSPLAGTYELDNNHLTISWLHPNTNERVEIHLEIHIEGDLQIQKHSNGLESRMRRVSQNSPDDPSIVGKWEVDVTEHRSFFESTILEYTKSGEFTFHMPLSSGKGRYSISGDSLTATMETDTKISKFRFESGFLFLQSPPDGGPEDKFKRIDQI